MQTAVACAGLLRRSEGQHLVTALPIPVTSRFGAPLPVKKTSAFSRSHKEELKNFLSRKKWALPGARYPGTSASGAEKCDTQERRLSLSTNAETAAHGGATPATRTEDEHDPPALNSGTCTERSSFERRVRRRAERFGTEEKERGNGGDATAAGRSDVERSDDDEPRRSSSSRVHRVADFAKWATRVAEEAAADAASDSSSVDWRRERRRRKAAKSVAATTAVPVGSTTTAADSHQDAGAAERASREATRLIAPAPSAAGQRSEHSVQIGARAHRTASAGGGFRVTATIDDAVDDDAQNDAESQRQLWSAAAPKAARHSRAPANDDLQRKRKRALTADRGRRVLGSRRSDELRGILKNIDDTRFGVAGGPRRSTEAGARLVRPRGTVRTGSSRSDGALPVGACSAASEATRQRDRWIHELESKGVDVRGDGSPEHLARLGSQRQRAEAYAAAAARATPGGGDRPTPVALGSSIPEGLEARAAAAMSLDELVKLPTYSMARDSSESGRLRSPGTVPHYERVAGGGADAEPRRNTRRVCCARTGGPQALTDVYTPEGVRLIMALVRGDASVRRQW